MIYDPEKLTNIFSLKGRGGNKPVLNELNLQSCCPFQHYKPDKGFYYERNPSFGINVVTGQWNCYGCGQKGPDLQSLADKLKVDLPIIFRTYDAGDYVKEKEEFFDYTLSMFTINQDSAQEYLSSRGIDNVVVRYNIGMSDNKEHLYLPMIDPDGKFYGWVERNMSGTGLRYTLKPEGIDRKTVLFGQYQLDKSVKRGIFVESPMDALKMSSLGDNALASCGAAVTTEQLEKLLDHFNTIYLVPQNDEAGGKWLKKCVSVLKGRCALFVTKLPSDYKDLGDVSNISTLKKIFRLETKLVR